MRGYNAQLLLTAVLIGMGLNRLHGPKRCSNVELYGNIENRLESR